MDARESRKPASGSEVFSVSSAAGTRKTATHTDPPLTQIRRRVIISGRVQGVGFRQATRDEAQRHRIAGWVRNLRDGRVEAVLEGPPGEVVAMVEWCRHGPPMARVVGLEVSEETPELLSAFRIASTA